MTEQQQPHHQSKCLPAIHMPFPLPAFCPSWGAFLCQAQISFLPQELSWANCYFYSASLLPSASTPTSISEVVHQALPCPHPWRCLSNVASLPMFWTVIPVFFSRAPHALPQTVAALGWGNTRLSALAFRHSPFQPVARVQAGPGGSVTPFSIFC